MYGQEGTERVVDSKFPATFFGLSLITSRRLADSFFSTQRRNQNMHAAHWHM
jgi:hypothetical protein